MSDEDLSLKEMRAMMKRAREQLEVATFSERIREVTKQLNQIGDSKVVKSAKNFGDMFKSMAKASFQGAVFSMLMETLQPLIDLLMVFSPIFESIGVLLQAVFLPVIQDLMPIINFLVQAIISLVPYAQQLWNIIKFGLIAGFQGLIVTIRTLANLVAGVFMFVWEGIIKAFNFIRALYDTTIAVVWNLMIGAFTFVRDVARAVVNVIIDIINGVMNTLTLGFWADIPHFATGGIVTSPTVGMIGEKGTEQVIRKEQVSGMVGGNADLHLIDMKEIMQEQLALQKKQARTMDKRRFG